MRSYLLGRLKEVKVLGWKWSLTIRHTRTVQQEEDTEPQVGSQCFTSVSMDEILASGEDSGADSATAKLPNNKQNTSECGSSRTSDVSAKEKEPIVSSTKGHEQKTDRGKGYSLRRQELIRRGTASTVSRGGDENVTDIHLKNDIELLGQKNIIEREREIRITEKVLLENAYSTMNAMLELTHKTVNDDREKRKWRYEQDERERERRVNEAIEWEERRRKEIAEAAARNDEEARSREEDFQKREEKMTEYVAEAMKEVEKKRDMVHEEILERERELMKMAEKKLQAVEVKEERFAEEVRRKEDLLRKEKERMWDMEERRAREDSQRAARQGEREDAMIRALMLDEEDRSRMNNEMRPFTPCSIQ